MAYPTIYNVTYSYTGFQQSQGNNAFPGTQIDADFAGLLASVSNLALFVQGVLRSDGLLNNNLVTFDSLAPALQTAGLAPATAWATGVAYQTGNSVVINSNLYRLAAPHTSGVFATDLAAGKWVFVTALLQGTNGVSYGGTSVSSLLIANNVTRVFTTQAGLGYNGSRVRAASGANPVNYMEGVCTYSGTTLTMAVDAVGGSGTLADWQLSIAGQPGSVSAPSCELVINKSVNIDQTWAGNAAFADGSNNPHPGASRATETYGPDNWRIGADSGTGNFTGRRWSLPGTVPGIDNLLRIDVTTADASATASNNYHVEIPVEGPRAAQLYFGAAQAQPVTIQFWWAGVNGTYAVSLVEGITDSRSCTKTFTYTGGGGAQQFILTFPADTAGTWSRAAGAMALKIIFDLGCGSSFETSSVGVWQAGLFLRTAACSKVIATGASVNYITGLQADVGSVALPYRHIDIAVDLLACQRFYYKSFDQATAVAQNAGAAGCIGYIAQVASSTAGYAVPVRYPTALVSTPTITTFNPLAANAKWRNQSLPADSGTPTIFNPGTGGFNLYNPQVAGDVVAALLGIHFVANARMGGF